MNLSVSPQMRVVALAGLLAVLGLAVAVFTFSRHHSSSSSSSSSSSVPSASSSLPGGATLEPSRARGSASGAPVTSRPATKPVAATKPKHVAPKVPSAVRLALDQGWPRPIAKAFARHRVVVAVLYSSEAALDRDALAEARAGAGQTGVPIVSLDVSAASDSATRKVLQKLGLLDAPATLVLQRPGKLFLELDGYSDKETVAQAVANAALPS
jgi:hypothetical protein